MKKPSILTGALIGGLFTIPLMAIFFLGQAAAGLPFPPFELFDWIARNLPGGLITFGIDLMVSVITALGLPTSETAKLAEQAMGLGFTVLIGVIAGGVFVAVMNATQKARNEIIPGLGLGLGVGIPFFLMGMAVAGSVTSAEPTRAALWTLALFALYGIAVSMVWNVLTFHIRNVASVDDVSADPINDLKALDRRSFLVRVGAGAATITVAGVGIGELLRRSVTEPQTALQPVTEAATENLPQAVAEALPNADDPVAPAPGTRPEVTPLERHYRIDINSSIPVIPEEGYTMPVITRLVDGERTVLHEFTLDEIRAMPSRDDYVTMSCISNRLGGDLISTVRWTGVPMQDFLATLDVPPNATHLLIMSYDGFDETVALDLINSDERIMLAYEWEGQPLLQKHGFPLRIHIPDLYGMKQPKWIIQMEFIEGDRDGYWVRRGWDKDAIVRTTSVIDTVAVDSVYEVDSAMFIPIGGIAWSGARGVSAVEVRVDNGEWQAAEIRSPIGDRTWSLWRYDWAFQEGMHTFEVRCAEGDGTPQIERVASTHPSGATGIVSRTTFIEGNA